MGIITVIGSMNMDLVVRTPRIPRAGETLAGTEFHTIPGGKGANQAVAAARAGAQTFMVGCVGRDAFGKELQDSLTCARVDVSGVESLAGISTGTATILVEDGGQNRIIIVAGANGEVTPAIIEKEWSAIQKSDLILLQHEIPLETIHFTLQKAHSQNIATLLNPAPFYAFDAGLLHLVNFLVLNDLEATALTHLEVNSVESALKAALLLRLGGAGSVIITLGALGAVLLDAESALFQPAFEVDAVDSTAAGDTFIGAFAASFLSSHDPESALLYATAASALSVTRLGAQTSIPRREEVEKFIRQHNNQQVISLQQENTGGETELS